MSDLQDTRDPRRYPIPCPHCAAKAGFPVAVMTVANHPHALRLDFQCTKCHHRWWQQIDDKFASSAFEQPS